MARNMSFSGCIYLAEVNDDGSLKGTWESPGEAYPLTIELTEETVKIMGRRCDTAGKVVATKSKPADAGGSLTLHEYTVGNVAKALRGLITKKNVTASTLVEKEITLGKLGEWVELGAEDLSSVVVTDYIGVTTHVQGEDYAINPVLGLISPLKSALTEKSVKVSAESGADTGTSIAIGAGRSAKYAVKGNLIDDFSGDSVKLYLRKVLLTASKGVSFVSEDGTEYENLEFGLIPEIPTGQSDYGVIDGLPI